MGCGGRGRLASCYMRKIRSGIAVMGGVTDLFCEYDGKVEPRQVDVKEQLVRSFYLALHSGEAYQQ